MTKTWYLTLFLLVCCSSNLLAQVPAWGGGADQNDLSFGFTFSYLSSNYKIIKKPNWQTPFVDPSTNTTITTPLTSITSSAQPGFAIGFITRYRLTDHLEARTTPSLIFADRSLYYTYTDPSQDVTKQVQTTMVEFPLLLKLKSDRLDNFRAYLIGGIKYSLAVGAKLNSDAQETLLNKKVKNIGGYGSYEIGMGCDIYFEFFKLSPEIKLSNSMGNVLLPENQPFSSPISKLMVHTIMFSLYFE